MRLTQVTEPGSVEREDELRIALPEHSRVFELCRIASMQLFTTRVKVTTVEVPLLRQTIETMQKVAAGAVHRGVAISDDAGALPIHLLQVYCRNRM